MDANEPLPPSFDTPERPTAAGEPTPPPAPILEQASPEPILEQASPAPILEQASPAPILEQASPAPVAEQASPEPIVHGAGVAPAEDPVSLPTPEEQAPAAAVPAPLSASGIGEADPWIVPERGGGSPPLELRQIAGLTAGIRMVLDHAGYEFAEGGGEAAFTIAIDENDRAVIVPGSVPTKLDTVPVEAPTVVGSSALDVGSARFLVQTRRARQRAADWLDGADPFTETEHIIEVPDLSAYDQSPEARQRRRFGRKRSESRATSLEPLEGEAREFIDHIRAVRTELAERERQLHPDPAELADRIAQRAPILRVRAPGHPLFAKVNVIVADMPWLPAFDDIKAIPDELGPHLQPLMSLPSIPIAADLLVGPLGIVGSRVAATACARHILTSLAALSTNDLRIHVATGPERARSWDWCRDLIVDDQIDLEAGFPVVIVDGMENFGRLGLDHKMAMELQAAVVILAESIDDLPSYSGSVLQVDLTGSALLTNHLGHVIAGTPVGLAGDFAAYLANGLAELGTTSRI